MWFEIHSLINWSSETVMSSVWKIRDQTTPRFEAYGPNQTVLERFWKLYTNPFVSPKFGDQTAKSVKSVQILWFFHEKWSKLARNSNFSDKTDWTVSYGLNQTNPNRSRQCIPNRSKPRTVWNGLVTLSDWSRSSLIGKVGFCNNQ